mmetsp:Transcript_22369/g.55425  ORF Transcript_22369/g.55425 Transcript_22369/m.55425 type:complete len:828 (-) Transcript_22369:1565-4048(-)
MATCVEQRMIVDVADHSTILDDNNDDDNDNDNYSEYTEIEYIDYEVVEDKSQTSTSNQRMNSSSVSVETVEDDEDEDDDEYTYEEETVLDAVMEEKDEMEEFTTKPPPLSAPYGETKLPPSLLKQPPPPSAPIPAYVPTTPMTLKKPPPSTLLSPSQQRATNSAGLSELSKQLRILQAKNESQNVDINRLERQLRILADLQGISVDNLRNALENACASEAFGELQHTVQKLKHELEAATLLKQGKVGQNAAAKTIANLELKVGELEEVEEQHALEIRQLYDRLRQETSRKTQFESENQQLKRALQDMITRVQTDTAKSAQMQHNYQKQLQELRERQAKMMQEQVNLAKSASVGSVSSNSKAIVSPEMAKEYEQMVQLLKSKDEELRQANAKLHADEIRKAEALKATEEKNHKAQLDMKVQADKLALTIKELEDADGQNGLRLAQFKARFAVQNERIVDQNQQLDSMYTAFDLLKEEFDSENDERAAMLRNLNQADAEMAKQTQKLEEKQSGKKSSSSSKSSSRRESPGFPPLFSSSNEASLPRYVSTASSVAATRPAIATLAPVSPATPISSRASRQRSEWATPLSDTIMTPAGKSYSNSMTPSTAGGKSYSNYSINKSNYSVNFDDTPTTYATARAYHPTPEKTPTTWDILRNKESNAQINGNYNTPQEGQLICGSLIVESNSMLRKWKTRASRIYMRGEGYQWDIGEKRSFPIRFGISKVEFHPNYPLSFAVSLDPTSPNAPVIRAATANEHEYHRWMKALYKATTGEPYEGRTTDLIDNDDTIPPAYSRPSPPRASYSQPASTVQEDSEDVELQRILELSKFET